MLQWVNLSPRAFLSHGLDPIDRSESTTFEAALRDPAKARSLTGIDLTKLDAILQFGSPENPVTASFLAGPASAFDGVHDALTRRGFVTSEESKLQIYALGDDGSILNDATMDPADPFGKGAGWSERIAIGNGEAIAAKTWDDLRRMLPIRSCPAVSEIALYARMADAGEIAAASAQLVRALAVSATAFGTPPIDESTLSPNSRELLNLQRLQERPARLTAALLTVAASPAGEIAEISLLYPSRSLAQSAAVQIRDGLQQFAPLPRPSGTTFSARTVELAPSGVATAVISAHFPASPAGAAVREQNV
jgi:hypothetical protein